MYILKRNNTYYYKLKIPKYLPSLIKLSILDFIFVLKSKKEALFLASSYTSKYYKLFLQLQSGIYSEEELISFINDGLYLNKNHRTLKKVNNSLPKNKILSNSWFDKTQKVFTFVFNGFLIGFPN